MKLLSTSMRKYERTVVSTSFQPKQRSNRKHKFQLHERKASDGVRGVQINSFYFRIARQSSELPEYVVEASSMNAFKIRFDEALKNDLCKFDYEASKPKSDS